MFITDVIVRLDAINFSHESTVREKEINAILDEYGVRSNEDVPEWFASMLLAVWNCEDRSFQFSYTVDDLESIAGSIALELKDKLNWQVEDEGEWARLRFPVSQVEVLIMREGACMCIVRKKDSEEWADWQTWRTLYPCG